MLLYKREKQIPMSASNPQGPALGRRSSQCRLFVVFLPLQQAAALLTLLPPCALVVAGALHRQRRLAGKFLRTSLGGQSPRASAIPMLSISATLPSLKTTSTTPPPSMLAFTNHRVLCCLGSQPPQKMFQRYS